MKSRTSPATQSTLLTKSGRTTSNSSTSSLRPTRGKDYTKRYFLLILIWIHVFPTQMNIRNVLHTRHTGFISESTFRKILKPMLNKIASKINYIFWENRLRHDNHSVFFPKGVTRIVDCAPIRKGNPRRSRPAGSCTNQSTSMQS